MRDGIESFLRFAKGRLWPDASHRERLHALATAVRRPALDAMRESERRYREQDAKRLYYLSMEFLMGRALGNNLTNLGLYDQAKHVVSELGDDLEELEHLEPDAALGNGGLGRLAACFLDSLATLDLPGFGYGINYEFGLFRQTFINGYQQERPDHWLEAGSPWLIERTDEAVHIPVYGSVANQTVGGVYIPKWTDYKIIVGVPHDMPIVGYGGRTVNVLRLFSARASDQFDIGIFNTGDYIRAVQDKITGENISKVLYPSDTIAAGKELRLLQEYFLVACSVRDLLQRYRETHESLAEFADKVAIQMNDTHPALTIAELMRFFVDEERMPWEEAWLTTVATCGYTNHTLLPEALERWSFELLARVLPRHLQIIQEINRRLLADVERRFPGDIGMQHRVAIIADGEVRMANLAMEGSHSINGVAALHSQLVTTQLAPDFYKLHPERFNNKTNGVTPRRWLLHANRPLSSLITKTIGDEWITNLDRLRELELFADDAALLEKLDAVKRRNKVALARLARELTGVTVDPRSMFDVQVKRIHEYKRQLLNALHVIHRYWSLVEDRQRPAQSRTVFFAGKAAPGYWMAKLIIKLIHSVAEVVNADPRSRDMLRVVFLPDYRVTLAEAIMPAAELSEQISTAGKEASGTGNMKLALNGALTIGTLDGANVEIRDEVGDDNIFIFGLHADEVGELLASGYDPQRYLHEHPWMRRAVDSIAAGHFSRGDKDIFRPIVARLLSVRDEYVHLADLPAYVDAQAAVDRAYLDRPSWNRKSLLNIARMGKFSSDRTIAEYARDIWGIKPAVIGNFAHVLD
ncbi:MAG: glycogen/starch/alpha-glucan phosphorylase [Acidobacteria bacterium]|nr:glycogen/starch/alpha-glucan phosphorylase [Acidobacteriota bacterium]MBV9475122.1 glycogen/starch/alpha-glucan phosphorylase [Acidobacteriota bacterium]